MFLLISRSLVVAFQHFLCFVPVTVGEGVGSLQDISEQRNH